MFFETHLGFCYLLSRREECQGSLIVDEYNILSRSFLYGDDGTINMQIIGDGKWNKIYCSHLTKVPF